MFSANELKLQVAAQFGFYRRIRRFLRERSTEAHAEGSVE